MEARPDSRIAGSLEPKDVELLAGYLEEETGVQRKLLEQLQEKERCLVSQDVEAIRGCLRDTAPLVNRLEEMTHRRIRILRSLGRKVGMREEDIQMPALIRCVEGDDAARLETARQELKDVLRRIGEQNRKNQVLVRNGIELNRSLVHALFGCEGLPVYDKRGRSEETTHVQACVSQEY